MFHMHHALSRLTLAITLVACRERPPSTGAAGADSATPARSAAAPAPARDSAAGRAGGAVDVARGGAVDSALAVVRGYYAALNARDYPRAYAAWAGDGPPGRPTPAAFAAGNAGTDSVALTVGTPGRVEGAAGSRYVVVPVTLRAFERGGRQAALAGTYTLRRSVVPGAGAANRRWHLYRAALRREPGR